MPNSLNGAYRDSSCQVLSGGSKTRQIAESMDRTWEWSVSDEGHRSDVALTSSEQELRLLVDTIPTLVWTAGPEGDIEYANKRVLEYFGATLDEIIGNGWVEKVHPDDVAFKTRTWLANLESRT